jgi:type IV secretory pathway VirJ component
MGIHVGFGSDIPERLAASGVPVVAVSSPVLFGEARTADYARSTVAASIAEALARSGAQRVTLIGFSFGADLLGATLGRLDPALRRRIAGVVLVGPASDVHFHANPFGIFYRGPGEAEPARMAASLRGLPLSCIYAAAETDSLCRDPLLREARLRPIDDNHLMLAHREEVTRAVVDAVLHPPEPLP